MEYGSIEREIRIDATPATVYDVITQPEHIAQWWGFDASFEAVPGDGRMARRRPDGGGDLVVPVYLVQADPPRRFVFRWAHPQGEPATPRNSFLVTFDLSPIDGGTLLRLTEVGFREVGWETAQLEAYHHDHTTGWDQFLPHLAAYAADLVRT